jgi:hypothetical protein
MLRTGDPAGADGRGNVWPGSLPPGWEAAATKLARRKAEQFKRLAYRLSAS